LKILFAPLSHCIASRWLPVHMHTAQSKSKDTFQKTCMFLQSEILLTLHGIRSTEKPFRRPCGSCAASLPFFGHALQTNTSSMLLNNLNTAHALHTPGQHPSFLHDVPISLCPCLTTVPPRWKVT
jgi:hypothetical protein